MAGAAIPLTPAVHQMITVGPIPLLEQTGVEIAFPIVRDMDALMYERQYGGDMEVGSYAHRPILMSPDEIPSLEESELSPTELPFTSEDFEAQMAHARELIPEILGVEGAGIRYAINGLLSLTPDGTAGAGRDARGEEPLVGGGRVDQGRPGRRPRRCRVGRRGRLRDRRARLRHRALPSAPARPAPRRRAHVRGLQQDLRDRPSRRAMGEQPERPRQPVPPARAGARRRLLRDGRLGAPLVVRVERDAARGVRRPGDAARGRVGVALVVADRERRAPGDARPGRDDRPVRVPPPRRQRPGRARGAPAHRARRAGRRARPRGLHAGPRPQRRLQGRPDDHAARAGAVPDRHRRRTRDGRPEVVLATGCRRTARRS